MHLLCVRVPKVFSCAFFVSCICMAKKFLIYLDAKVFLVQGVI